MPMRLREFQEKACAGMVAFRRKRRRPIWPTWKLLRRLFFTFRAHCIFRKNATGKKKKKLKKRIKEKKRKEKRLTHNKQTCPAPGESRNFSMEVARSSF